jgi:hypothetical protein
MPSSGGRAFPPIGLLEQKRTLANCPAMNGRVINGYAALRHHLLEIASTETVSQILPDTQ